MLTIAWTGRDALKRLGFALSLTLVTSVLPTSVLPTSVLPAMAQANPHRVTCQATTPLAQGGNLIYQLTGTVPATTQGAVPQNPIGTGLTLTVQRRDAAGRVKTLIRGTSLSDYEQIAPDADYSRLPFSGTFRGQPNNGHRLYSATASVNGLYVSLRPHSGQPQQVQVVHYLSRGQFVRSGAGTCQSD